MRNKCLFFSQKSTHYRFDYILNIDTINELYTVNDRQLS